MKASFLKSLWLDAASRIALNALIEAIEIPLASCVLFT